MIKPVEITPGVFRGSQPTSPEDFAELKRLGIIYSLDLETGARLLADGSPLQEMLTAEKYGIVTYCHPLGEILPPSGLELALAASLIASHKPIYVHCKAGVDRTGMVMAHWRILIDNLPREIAIYDMRRHGMHLWYYWWAWFL